MTTRATVCFIVLVLTAWLTAGNGAWAFSSNAERVQAAVGYLEASQNADGSWGGRAALRDTSEVLRVLGAVAPESAGVAAGVGWLAGQEGANLDYLARTLEAAALTGTPDEEAIERLLSALEAGGWGAGERLGHDLLTTLVVARSLDRLGRLDPVVREAVVATLLAQQDADGSFAYTAEAASSIYLTAEALVFFSQQEGFPELSASCERAAEFLLAQQEPEGGIGAHLYETLAAARALLRVPGMSAEQLTRLFAFIHLQQGPDGSFGADPFPTALGLDLLASAAPNLAVRSGSVSLSNPQPQPGETVTLTAVIDNLGSEAAAGVPVALYNRADAGNELLAETHIEAIPSRGSASVTLDFTLDAVGSFQLSLDVDGEQVVVEQDESDNTAAVEVTLVDTTAPEIRNLALDYEYISPNGDGVKDAATVSFELSEPATLRLTTSSALGLTQTVLKPELGAGPNALVWEGRGADGTLLPDGRYTLSLTARDAGGNESVVTTSVVLDLNREHAGYVYADQGLPRLLGWNYCVRGLSQDGTVVVGDTTPWSMTQVCGDDKIIDLATGIEYPIPAETGSEERVAKAEFSPDGSRILISGSRYTHYPDSLRGNIQQRIPSGRGLFITDRFGGNRRQLVGESYEVASARWSPDGRTVYFQSRAGGDWQLYQVDLSTGEVAQVDVRILPYPDGYRISSSGQYIVYWVRSDGGNVLCLLDTGSKVVTEIMNSLEHQTCNQFDWSNDGSLLLAFRQVFFGATMFYVYDIQANRVAHEVEAEAGWAITAAHFSKTGDVRYYANFDDRFSALDVNFKAYSFDLNNGVSSLIWSGDPDNLRRTVLPRIRGSSYPNAFVLQDTLSPDRTASIYRGDPYPNTDPYAPVESIIAPNVYRLDLETFESERIIDFDSLDPSPVECRSLNWDPGYYRSATWLSDASGIVFSNRYDRSSYHNMYVYAFGTPWPVDVCADGPVNPFNEYACTELPDTTTTCTETVPQFVDLHSLTLVPDDRCTVEISGLVADANFSSYTVEYRYLDDPDAEWQWIATGSYAVIEGVLARWNVCGLPQGNYEIRIVVEDKAGNVIVFGGGSDRSFSLPYAGGGGGTPEETISFYLENLESIFAGVNGPQADFVFSPNGDGVLDTAEVSYALAATGEISLWVTGVAGDTVRTLLENAGQSVGVYSFAWDGTTDGGAPVAEGWYTLHLASAAGAAEAEELTFAVTVDTTAPQVAVISPAAGVIAGRRHTVVGTATDAHLREYQVQYQGPAGGAWLTVQAGTQPADAAPLLVFDAEGLEGEYALRVVASDRGGNVATAERAYVIDSSAPAAWIAAPAAGTVVGDTVWVQAETRADDLQSVRFEIRADQDTAWSLLGRDADAPFTATFETDAYNHGVYWLRAVATDRVGNTDGSPLASSIRIDRQAPTSWIASPAEGAVVGGVLPLEAETDDTDVAQVVLSYCSASDSAWSPLTTATSRPYRGVLDTTVFPDGRLYLRSLAQDTSSLTEASPTRRGVWLDNTPPSVALSEPEPGAVVGGQVAIRGSAWDANPAGYAVAYRAAAAEDWVTLFESAEGITDGQLATWDTGAVVGGEYEVRVTAVDAAANTRTAIVPVTVRNQAPRVTEISTSAEFVSAAADSPVVQLAYTLTEDAARVALDVLDGAGAVLFRAGDELPRLAGSHTYAYACLDGAGLPLGDGRYTLRLTAADPFGNATAGAASFVVDSTPPVISVDEPLAGADVFAVVDVVGYVDDVNLARYELWLDQGDGEVLLADFDEPPTGLKLASLDLTALEGAATLRLAAVDRAGNTAEPVLVPVVIHDPAAPIFDLALSAAHLRAAPLEIAFSLSREAAVTAKIYGEGASPLRTLEAGVLPAGPQVLAYDLRDAVFGELSEGDYRVEVSLLDLLTGTTTTHGGGQFTVDTTAPQVAILSPQANAVLADNAVVTGEVADPHLQGYRLEFGVGVAPANWVLLGEGSGAPIHSELGIFETAGLEGLYTLRLSATDRAGNGNVASAVVNVPAGAAGLLHGIALAPAVISPNGDGVQDAATLNYTLGAPRDLQVTVEREATDGTYTVVKTLYVMSAEPAGDKQHTWDGTDQDGAPLADGVYRLWLRSTDAATQEHHEYLCGAVLVDTLAPQLEGVSPVAGSTVIDTVEVSLQLTEAHPARYRVEYKEAEQLAYTLLAEGDLAASGASLAQWNTRGLSGEYDLRVTATDRAGNASQAQPRVHVVDGNLALLSDVSLSGTLISPNGDGQRDDTAVAFALSRGTVLSATVRNAQGQVVRSLASDVTLGPGEYALAFDGCGDGGGALTDGAYAVVLTALDPVRGSTLTLQRELDIDTTAPAITVSAPVDGSFVAPRFTVSGLIAEPHLRSLRLTYLRDGLEVIRHLQPDADGKFSLEMDGGTDNGSVLLALEATDAAGNVALRSCTVQVDSAPPLVSLALAGSASQPLARTAPRRVSRAVASSAAPLADGTPVLGGEVLLSYTATDTNLATLSLAYASAETPDVWVPLHSAAANALNALLAVDTTQFPGDGRYSLRLLAEDRAGNSSETTLPIEVDNTPPTVSIVQPDGVGVITGPTAVTGTVTDAWLLRYEVKQGAGAAGPVLQTVGSYTGEIADGVLHEWLPPQAEGPYTVAVEAVDVAGNRRTAFAVVTVDTLAPAAPAGLGVSLNEEKRPVLSWTGNGEADLAGYRVYRGGVLLAVLGADATGYTDTAELQGDYTYALTAFDHNGNVGEPGTGASIRVDTVGPTVAITSPSGAAVYGGLVPVAGTATSSDFHGFTLEVEEPAGSGNWRTLTTSPAPVDGGLLGYYASFGVNGPVTLRLTGRDIAGNVSMAETALQVDNVAPASPQGVVAAVANGADLELVWQANSDADLAGYRVLLYGNRLHPELLSGTTYTYAAAPDGTYRFTVVAVDHAGNESVPSFPQEITLDNRVPRMTIAAPVDGAVIDRADPALLVTAATSDYDVVLVQFQFRAEGELPWQDIGPAQVTEIFGTPDAPIDLGAVGVRLDVAALADGSYQLRAVATDRSSQQDPDPPVSTFALQVPPAVPQGVAAHYAAGTASLSWLANGEPDLAGYTVLRDGVPVATVAAPATAFAEPLAADGSYRYQLRAYDVAGHESAGSEDVAVTVDATPPLLAFTAPAAGARIAGSVEVWGTLTEANPATLVLEISPGGADSLYQVLATVEGPAPTGPLHLLQTDDYASGEYTLRLRASDAVGNQALPVTRSVTIDHVAPTAPLGLVAVAAADGSVNLEWESVADPAPLTYRLYCRGEGESDFALLTTLTGTSHASKEDWAAGASYAFVVTAVDSVGNESGHSNVATVTPGYTVTPQTPVLYHPAPPGGEYVTGRTREDLVAYADPNLAVSLVRGGSVSDTRTAPAASGRALLYDDVNNFRPAVSPDGTLTALFQSGYLYLRDNASGTERRALDSYVGYPVLSAWSPDGSRLAYLVSNRIRVFDLASSTETTLSADTYYKYEMAWDPAGTRVAAVCYAGGYDVWLYSLAGGDPVRLTSDATRELNLAWSPDGAWLAYDRSNRVYLLDVAGGTETQLTSAYRKMPSFSPDGAYIATVYSSRMYVDHLGSGDYVSIAVAGGPLYPKWAPHGRELLFSTGYNTIGTLGYDPVGGFGAVEEHGTFVRRAYARQHGWTGDGRFWVYSTDPEFSNAYHLAEPRSRFVFRALELAAGPNVFSAYATNDAGEESPASAAVTIVHDSELPAEPEAPVSDLYMVGDRLFLVPTAPIRQQPVTVQATVRNDSATLRSDVVVELEVRAPDGSAIPVGGEVSIDTLGAGEERVVVFQWTPQCAGEHELLIRVDPRRTQLESDEGNNTLRRTVAVGRSQVAATLVLAQSEFGPGEEASLTLVLSNQGSTPETVEYTVALEDEQGAAYATVASGAAELTAYGTLQREPLWHSGNVMAGDYLLHLQVHSASGALLADATQTVTIRAETGLFASLHAGSTAYLGGATASLSARVGNLSGNASALGVSCELVVSDPSGVPVYQETRQLPEILIRSEQREDFQMEVPNGVLGGYQALLRVYHDGLLAAVATTAFDVLDVPSAPLSSAQGALSVVQSRTWPGGAVTLHYEISNSGTEALVDAFAQLELIDPVRELPLRAEPLAVALQPGEGASRSLELQDLPQPPGPYMVLLTADLAGERVVLDHGGFEIDGSAPQWLDGVGLQHAVPADGGAWLYWNDATDRSRPVRWNVYYATESPIDFATATCLPAVVAEADPLYDWRTQVTGLVDGVTYYFAVRAEDGLEVPNEDTNGVELAVRPWEGPRFSARPWGQSANGLAVADLDRDGIEELLLATETGLTIWSWGGSADLVDVTGQWGEFAVESVRSVLAVDLDNDGDRDVVTAGDQLRLYANDGTGGLAEVTGGSGLANPAGARSSGVGALVADADPYLDLIISFDGAEQQLGFFRNAGDGDGDGRGDLIFSAAPEQGGLTRSQPLRSVAAADVDGDGDTDLLLAGGSETRLFFNDGAGAFGDATAASLPVLGGDAYGATFGDWNGDGATDVFLADASSADSCLLNDGSGAFFGSPCPMSGLRGVTSSRNAAAADFDHDGDVDLFVSGPDGYLLHANRGDGAFFEMSQGAGVRPGGGQSAVFADVDGDRDLDLVTSDGVWFQNLRDAGDPLIVDLAGTLSNADAVGSRVWIYAAGHLGEGAFLVGYAEVAAASGYAAQSTLTPRFSVPADADYAVRVRFPSGIWVDVPEVTAGQTLTVVEDNTPPVTVADYPHHASWVNRDALITLTATDDISGVAETRYRLDGVESVYSGPVAVSSEGDLEFAFWSTDAAENVEQETVLSVRIDKTPPVTGHDYTADGVWVREDVTVNLAATDEVPGIASSGVARTFYRVDGAPPVTDSLWLAFSEDGTYLVEFWSEDVAGNQEAAGALRVWLDKTPPESTLSVGLPQREEGEVVWVTSGTPFSLTASDGAGVGVAAVEYALDGEAVWHPYTAPFTLSGAGNHVVAYRSADAVGNLEPARQRTVVVDDMPPTTTIEVGMPNHPASALFVAGGTPFTLHAADAGSGVGHTEFRVNDGPWSVYSGPFTLEQEGWGEDGAVALDARSLDHLGNVETAQRLDVVRDDTPPAVSAGADLSVYAGTDGTRVVTLVGAVSDGDGYDPAPSITWSLQGTVFSTTAEWVHRFPIGTHLLTLEAIDHLGNHAADTAVVTVERRPVSLAYAGDTNGQWSDRAVLRVEATDSTPGEVSTPLVNRGEVTFRLMLAGEEKHRYVIAGTDPLGKAEVIHLFMEPDQPAGVYDIEVTFQDPSGVYAEAQVTQPYDLAGEACVLEYTGEQVVTIFDTGLYLQATVFQEEDEESGVLLDFDDHETPIWVQFDLYTFAQTPGVDEPHFRPAPVRILSSPLHPAVGVGGVFVPFASLGEGEENYVLTLALTDLLYASATPVEVTAAVFDPDGLFFTGGGHVRDPVSEEHNNFGFTFKFNSTGKPQGNLVFILRDESAGTKTRFKSDVLEGAGFPLSEPPGIPTAVAEGKGNVEISDLITEHYLGGAENLSFRLTVEDLGPGGVDEDTFRVEIRHADGVPFEPGHMLVPELLTGGNIVIHGGN